MMKTEMNTGNPVEQFMHVVKGKHKSSILIFIDTHIKRFSEIRRELPDISERILAKQLKELEREGIVSRTVYPEVPPRVEYQLTAYGSTLCPIIKQMWKWGRNHNLQKK